jgi:drug/metabolite transporter (DMT)-like permease
MPMLLSMLWSALSSGIHQVEAIAIKKYNNKHSDGGFIFTALVSLFAMVFFFIIDRDGLCFPPLLIFYGVIAGVFYCSASYLTFVAFGCGSYMLSNLFLSYTLVFSIAYGLFFLKEEITVFTYVGIALMFVSIFLSKSGKKSPDTDASKPNVSVKWIICITLSVIGAGMFGIMKKLQQVEFNNAYDNEFMIVTYVFTFVTLMIIGIIKDRNKLFYILRHALPYTAAAGVSNGVVNLLGLIILNLIPISVSAPMGSGIKIVITFLISLIIFKEKLTAKQLIGVILGTTSLILFNI